MWFLKGKPTAINVRAIISSIKGGYQSTNYRFSVDALSEEKIWIALAFPWAPHKTNGSLQIIDSDHLSSFEQSDEITVLEQKDIEIWGRLRSLKTQPNIDLVHVQELINWYLDDIGVITMWVEPSKTYQLNYRHKIAADSCLFFPTRIPVIIASHHPKMDYKLWVIDGNMRSENKWLCRETVHNPTAFTDSRVDCFTFKEWEWDDDTRVNTDNWESSDDDDELSSE